MTLTAQVLTDADIYIASADVSGYGNKVTLSSPVDALEPTTFGSNGWKARVGGLFDTTASVEGFWEAGDLTQPDDAFWANLGVNAIPATFVPTGGNSGDLCYFSKVLETSYDPNGQVGNLFAWSVDLQGNAPLVRGKIGHPINVARTATGTGSGLQIGAVGAGQRMYANLHVTAASGSTPSITVKVQSSVDNTFASPTDRIIFSAATTASSQVGSVLGAITDQWWRVVWSITGSTPSFNFACPIGIAAK